MKECKEAETHQTGNEHEKMLVKRSKYLLLYTDRNLDKIQ